MTTLERQVGRAQRRLTTNVFLRRAALGIFIAACAWTAVLLVERAFGLGMPIRQGVWIGALVAAAVAIVGTILARIPALGAAVTLDQAAGLKERTSTALTLRSESDPFARAVIRDAEAAVARVHVPAHLPYRAPTLWPWSAASVAAAALLAVFMPNLNLLAQRSSAEVEQGRTLAAAERDRINIDLSDRLNKIKELAENNPALADLAKDLQPLEMPDKPTVTPEDIRREAAKKIDSVTDRLAEQKENSKADALRETQRMLARLEPQTGQNPAAEMSQALTSGDFEGAKKSLEQLQQDLQEAAAKGDAAAKQRLSQMQDQLKKLADQLNQLDDAVYLQKELENKGGLSPEQAKKLAEELAKLDPKQLEKELQRVLGDKTTQQQIKELAKKIAQQQEAKKQCQGLGKCLSKAAEAAQKCNNPGSGAGEAQAAAAALSDAISQMSDMEMAEQTLAEIEAQLSDLRKLRDSCSGGQCDNPGDKTSDRIGPQGPNYGRGIGARIGSERVAHDVVPTKANTKMRGGTIIGQMLVDGPQVRGEATAAERDAVNAAQRDAQDAIDRDLVPRQYHNAVQMYFEQLAGLIRAAEAPPSTPSPTSQP